MFKYLNRGISTPIAIGIIAVLVVVVGGGIITYQYFLPQKNNQQQDQNQNQQQSDNQTNNNQPSITVVLPNGGEVLKVNESYKITWTSRNLQDKKVSITVIQYDKDNKPLGGQWIAFSIPIDQGYYNWTPNTEIPAYLSNTNKYKIKIGLSTNIENPDNAVSDDSDNYFNIATDQTTGWNIIKNDEYGFSLKYPDGFFYSDPKILVGDCSYQNFPNKCLNIYNLVVDSFPFVSSYQDWDKKINDPNSVTQYPVPKINKQIINDTQFCSYFISDAAMNQQWGNYYYATVKNQKCFVVVLVTHTSNCEVYLPLNASNTESYNKCLNQKANLPKTLEEVINTFEFTN